MSPSKNNQVQEDKSSHQLARGAPKSSKTAKNNAIRPEDSIDSYIGLLESVQIDSRQTQGALEELKTAPLFSWQVKQHAAAAADAVEFRQYAVLGQELVSAKRSKTTETTKPIFMNTDAPWSAFLCGSQGSGKSYTLSCILENCLLDNPSIGRLPLPMAGILLHYDPHNTNHPCEAAYLSSHVPVTVLVSPSNYWERQKVYRTISAGNIKVRPLLLQDHHLNVQRMRKLMAFKESDGSIPLYMEVILRLLRSMAMESRGGRSLGFEDLLTRLDQQTDMSNMQKGPMGMRLELIKAFMVKNYSLKKTFGLTQQAMAVDPFQTMPGTLTIVDLSDPFIDSQAACSLFDMCLALFMEHSTTVGRVIALDEAHKFMTATDASSEFTDSLLQLIREQRHKGARIVISTQEPTVSPKLLDLCSMTFVHRFTSPAWLAVLRSHLAGAAESNASGRGNTSKQDLMDEIINLNVGESLLFCSSAMIDLAEAAAVPDFTFKQTQSSGLYGPVALSGFKAIHKGPDINTGPPYVQSFQSSTLSTSTAQPHHQDKPVVTAVKLGLQHLRLRTRPRLTRDGGRSVLASTGVDR